MFKMEAYFGREGPVDSGSGCLKKGIFWEGGVDYGSVAYGGEEGWFILEGGLDSGRDAYLREGAYSGRAGLILGERDRFFLSVTYSCRKGEDILEGMDIFWEHHF